MGDTTQAPLLARERRGDRRSEDSGEGITDYGSGVYRYPLYLQPGQFTSLEKLMFFISSILLIILCLFIGLYARSSFDDRHWPPPRYEPPPSHVNDTEKYCLEPQCILSAAHILQDIDPELDPCDDFYAYTCSRWIEGHALPESRPKVDVKSVIGDSIKQSLHRLLLRGLRRPDGAQELPSPDWIVDQQLFNSLRVFYESCMNTDILDRRAIEPLHDMFRSIRRFLPLLQQDRQRTSDVCIYLGQRNVWPLFALTVAPNDVQFSVHIQHTPLSLPSRAYYSDESLMATYLDVISQILSLVFQQDTEGEFGWRSWSTVATARRILDFEKSLALIDVNRKSDPTVKTTWSLSELQEWAPAIDWTVVVGTLAGHNKDQMASHPPTFPVIAKDPAYVQAVSRLIEANNPRTLQMYLIWRSIWSYLDTLGEPFAAQKRILQAALDGIQPRVTPPRWETCLDTLDQNLGFLLGRYFVSQVPPTDIQSGTFLATQVKKAMKNDVETAKWFTENDRMRAVEKIHQIGLQIGYPTAQPDVRSAISMADYYGNLAVNETMLFENVLHINKQTVRRQWQRIGQSVNQAEWGITPQRVTAKYTQDMNTLVVPAGLLSWPFFIANGPDYLNYGALGWEIGHHMMHALEKHEWSARMQSKYDTQAQCLVAQYDGELWNNKTIRNAVADHGGLQRAWAAWRRDNNTNPLLPGLGHWTREQLFHIQFGRMACSKSTPEHRLHTRDHASDRWRVNGPLMNSNSFAQAFQCPIESAMNPSKKCKVW